MVSVDSSQPGGAKQGLPPPLPFSEQGYALPRPLLSEGSDAVSPAGAKTVNLRIDGVKGRHRSSAKGHACPSLDAFVDVLLKDDADQFRLAAHAALAEAGTLPRFEALYLSPAARRIGDLWLADACDFLAVTIAVSRMERFYRHLAAESRQAGESGHASRILLALAPGNQHSFGLAVVEERFRQAGWIVDCCGVGDGSEILQRVAAKSYDVLGLSVHCDVSLPALVTLLQEARQSSCSPFLKLLGGGSLAMEDAVLLAGAGFDRVAFDAASAVREASALLAPAATHFRAAAE